MFGKREKHEHAAWLIGKGSGGRTLCQIVFWIWGIGGLFVMFPGFGSPNVTHPGVPPLIGAMASLPWMFYWIGGLLVFGIGGALQGSDYDFKRPADTIHLGE
jgi:hypothetical protein